jgi:ABC-type nitrate/sulfonate/bicarbonate transport system permease component
MSEATGLVISLTCVAAWFNHIFTCFSEGLWGFLVAGALAFPIGIIHGMWLWFR